VVSDFINSTSALPHLVAEQRVAPSGEIRGLQCFTVIFIEEPFIRGNAF